MRPLVDERLKHHSVAFSQALQRLDKLLTSAEERQLFDHIKQIRETSPRYLSRVVKLTHEGKGEEASEMLMRQGGGSAGLAAGRCTSRGAPDLGGIC
jgi:hypothetical protein